MHKNCALHNTMDCGPLNQASFDPLIYAKWFLFWDHTNWTVTLLDTKVKERDDRMQIRSGECLPFLLGFWSARDYHWNTGIKVHSRACACALVIASGFGFHSIR